MFSLIRSSCLFLLSLVILWTAGCSQNIEQNLTFQDLVSRVDRLEESQKETDRKAVSLDNEFQQVTKDVAKITAKGPGAAPDATKALEQRIVMLERRLNELASASARPGAADAAEPVLPKQPLPAPATAGKKTVVSHVTGAGQPATAHATAKRAGRQAETRLAKDHSGETRTKKAGGGKYHQVAAGETLEKIAARYQIPAASILRANGLPNGAKVMPGQEIYIPIAGQ